MSEVVTTASPVVIAGSMLDHAAEVLASPVERAFVSHGEPASPTGSCDQLTVHLVRLRPKLLADSGGVFSRVPAVGWVASMATELWRCIPTPVEGEGDVPAADLDAAYRALLAEGVGIARHFSRLFFKDEWPELASCRDVTWGDLTPLGPQGGMAGFRLVVDVQL